MVLVAVDIVLVALAVARTEPTQNGTTRPVPTFTSTPRPSPSGTSTAPSGTPSAEAGTDRVDRFLAAVDGDRAWRATGGQCDGTVGTVEETTDSGDTWQPVDVGVDEGRILGLQATDDRVFVAIGRGADCTPIVRTSTNGTDWEDGADGDAGALLVSDELILRSGRVDVPCGQPLQAYEGQYTTAVVCPDEIRWRAGSGPWVGVSVPEARSIADDGDRYLIATTGDPACSGVAVRSMRAVGVTPATETAAVGCAEDAGNGEIVLARAARTVWLWSDDEVRVSNDGGTSW